MKEDIFKNKTLMITKPYGIDEKTLHAPPVFFT